MPYVNGVTISGADARGTHDGRDSRGYSFFTVNPDVIPRQHRPLSTYRAAPSLAERWNMCAILLALYLAFVAPLQTHRLP